MKRAKKILITGAFLILASLQLGAQIPNSLFFMPNVPQSNRINPAIQPRSGLYFGMPGLSPLRFQITSSALAFQDVFTYNSDIDAMITPFHPLGDEQAFLDQLDPVNYFLNELGLSPISFGFRAGKNYFSFDLTTRVDASINYPKGLFELPLYGLPDGETRSFSGLGIDFTGFLETSLGWSRRDLIIPNLDLGVRAKFLTGLANVNTANSVLELTASSEALNFNSDLEYNIAVPSFINITEADSSLLPDVDVDDTYFNNPPVQIVKEQLLNNIGFGVDIGINYQPIPQLMVSASVLDLGYINWNNTVTGNMNFAYDFIGINVNPFTGIDTTFIQELADSAQSSVSIVAGQPYRSNLNPKLFVGASFYPIEKIGFGLLSRTDFLNGKVAQQFTATANMTTGRFLNLSLSYTYMTSSVKNFGAGLSVNVWPFNLYIISDNVISGALWPTEAKSVNLWFGMNLCFGYRISKKVPEPKDRPLIL
ncbi:DUF5723 family protein [Bacteroidota bacterium]